MALVGGRRAGRLVTEQLVGRPRAGPWAASMVGRPGPHGPLHLQPPGPGVKAGAEADHLLQRQKQQQQRQ